MVQYENKPRENQSKNSATMKFFTFNLYFSAASSRSGVISSHERPSSSAMPGGYQLIDNVP
jgi:hypothetical protein